MTDFTEPRFDHPPRPMAQRVGAILWPSFFAAGVATMVFFAFVDPLALRDMTFRSLPMTRGLGYTIGTAGSNLQSATMFVAVVVVSGFGVFFSQVIRVLERRLERWRPAATR